MKRVLYIILVKTLLVLLFSLNVSTNAQTPLQMQVNGESSLLLNETISEASGVKERDTVISTEDELLGKSDIRGKLIITVTPSEASDGDVYINDKLEGKAPVSATLLPGNYRIIVKKQGFVDYYDEVMILKKETIRVDIEMIPLIVKRESGDRTWNWVISGLAVLGSAASVYYYTETQSNYDNYQSNTICTECEELKNKAEQSANRYNVSIIVNAATLIASLMLWIFN